jgi:pimeloyl-ACP methyl ester carboxylesterase
VRLNLAILILVGTLAGCAGASSSASAAAVAAVASVPAASPQAVTASPRAETPTPRPAATPDPNAIAGFFDVGGGRTLYLTCTGIGTPTIFLESGDESEISQWRLVAPALERETRTCAYERAGVGRSAAATGCRQLDDILGDLEALLKAAGVKGPFVLVGTSGGGFLMSAFAARHPDDVAGLVLVETPKAITILSPELKALIACDAPTNIERRDYVAVEHDVWDNVKRIGDFPMTIISNDYGAAAPPNDDAQTNVPDQRGWLVISPNSKQIVVTSGHDLPENEPDLVVREILAVLEAARRE